VEFPDYFIMAIYLIGRAIHSPGPIVETGLVILKKHDTPAGDLEVLKNNKVMLLQPVIEA